MDEDVALQFIKAHKRELINKFCSISEFPPSLKPFTMFMAGSPGAGKTEFSKSIIPELQKRDPESKIVRIDADEIREMIPQFNGHNSSEVQRGAIKGVEIIFDEVHHNGQNCILDGTFQNYEAAHRNITRALTKDRSVGIFYIYQDPLVAWEFTKQREAVEHRNVPKETFIKAFFQSKENVLKMKGEFGRKLELNVIIQDETNHVKKLLLKTETIAKKLHASYTMGSLEKLLD